MRTIPLVAIPNQRFTITVDDVRYDIAIKAARGVMVCDIAINGTVIITGARVLAGEMLIPFKYLENGNFILLTEGGDLPDYRQFGNTQTLVFFTPAELGAIRG